MTKYKIYNYNNCGDLVIKEGDKFVQERYLANSMNSMFFGQFPKFLYGDSFKSFLCSRSGVVILREKRKNIG